MTVRSPALIDPAELLAAIDTGRSPVILDVRSRTEYDAGHVPGAVHAPFWRVRAAMRRLGLPAATPLIVYCGHGPRAYLAGAALKRLGYESITYLAGHMAVWTRRGLRQERGQERA
jgi:rhodanese-related sulfurtransferase